MQTIHIKNQQIINLLNEVSSMDLCGNSVSKARGFDIVEYDIVKDYALSKSYLNKRLQNTMPNIEYAYNLLIGESEGGTILLQKLKTLLDYDGFYTSGYYPKGFVGWHSDTDISGYYIMLTYSTQGDGYYKYLENDDIVTVHDNKGWMIRNLYLGENANNAVWHCAYTDCPRYTFLLRYDSKTKFEIALNMMQVNND